MTRRQVGISEGQRIRAARLADTHLALRAMWEQRQLDRPTLAGLLKKDQRIAGEVLKRLVKTGLAEARGARRQRLYQLSARVRHRLGEGFQSEHGGV